MKAPQIIMIVLIALNIGIELVQHGETTETKHNVWTCLIGKAILVIILKCGGFF